MRGCHKEAMQEYRRRANAEEWAKPLRSPVALPCLATYNLQKRIEQAIRVYIEEAGIGE